MQESEVAEVYWRTSLVEEIVSKDKVKTMQVDILYS